MRRLILFRHGKAELAGLTGGDRERPLAARGRGDAQKTAQWLSAAGFVPDLVLVSPALRTRSTWQSASATFPSAQVEVRDSLYLAGSEGIIDELETAPPDTDTIMVVGHNPGLQELALELAIEGDAPQEQVDWINDGIPTATALVFRMRGSRSAAVEAVFAPPPRADDRPRWAFFKANAGEPD